MLSSRLRHIVEEDKKYLFQNYGDRLPVCFVRGDGPYLFDQDNRRYIDFLSGIAVNALGHHHAGLSKVLHGQVDRLLHTSNWFFNREQVEAAKLLSDTAFPGKSLFVNSGTEANEAAIKLARRYGQSLSPDRCEIISFENSFHGRTFGSMSATAQEKIRKGFGPLVPGFIFLPWGDTGAVTKELNTNPRVCAVILELIQGEGGIRIAGREFVKSLAALCKEKKVLLIIDEIQTGIGRTGRIFAYQHYGLRPDIITMAKGLGGGVPVGALHARNELLGYFSKGVHGTTFGGNHLASAASAYVLAELKKGAVMKNVKKLSDYFFTRLNELKEKNPVIADVRGLGLHIGIELKKPGFDIVKKALLYGLVINCTAEKVLRIMPPLTMPIKAAKEGMAIFEDILEGEAES
jgi:acetylornithine/N-succinyldiaminopimelate aminotransferase